VQTVLVTGSSGLVGVACSAALRAAGHRVVPFDVTDGLDLRDEQQVASVAAGCTAVVHSGALPHDTAGTPAAIMATNVLGTWHVLLAAERHSLGRVVYLSSAQVFGCAEGEGAPAYLPIDDRHPLRAARPYGLSKRLAEEMCQAWTTRTGIATVVLRPVLVLDDARLSGASRAAAELDAYVHVDDVGDAIVRSLTRPVAGHHRVTLCGPGRFDSSGARDLLGWHPRHGWPAQ
jgi:UDP-glucose 4-epimerase